MERCGYTYTTITAEPGKATRVCTSFYLDETANVEVYGAKDRRPFLAIDHGDVTVTIGPRPHGQITSREVDLIRQLAHGAAFLLAEVERLHTEQSPESSVSAA